MAYSDSLRAELHNHSNISVITIQPGYIKTDVPCNALTGGRFKNNMNNDDHLDCYSATFIPHQIVKAIVEKRKESLIAVPLHRLAIWLRFYFPNLLFSNENLSLW